MKKIAIRFGDNDFYNTFMGVLGHLKLAHEHNGPLTTNKEYLSIVISELAYVSYMTHQNHFNYNGMERDADRGEYLKRMKSYLKVKPNKILINEEVDEYVKSVRSWDNSETFVLDLTIPNGYIYSL